MNTCTRHFVIAQRWHHSFSPQNTERQREVGLWVVPPSLPLSPLHCLNPVLHQLVDSVSIDHQGRMKLTSLHQLFKTLKVVNDTVRTLLVGVQIDYFRWTAGEEQHLEFPFNTAGFASLPLPHRTPVGRSHIWLAGLFHPSGCVGKGTNSGRIRRGTKRNRMSDSLMKRQRDCSWEKQLYILDAAVLLPRLVIRVQRQRIRAPSFPNPTSD